MTTVARVYNIMEELAPLVTKVCVLQQKASQEVSKEKRHLLELLERRHRRYVEKKSCEALEVDTPQQSRDHLEDGGLDNGLDSFTEHVVKRAHERRMRRRRHKTTLNSLSHSLAQSAITATHMQTKGVDLELVGSFDSRRQPPCFPKPAWQSPQTKVSAQEKDLPSLPHSQKLRRSCKSASLPHLATPVKEHIRELCRSTFKGNPLASAPPPQLSLERSSVESIGTSSTSLARVKRNLLFSGNDDGFSVAHRGDARCSGGVAVEESADVSIGGSSFRGEMKGTGEPQTKRCTVVYLSERQSRLCPHTHIPMVPPVTPEPGQAEDVRYVQALHDCKSQRALKALLKAIEGNRVGEMQKVEMARVAAERERQTDSIARIKAQQRMEIYALNTVMSKLEEANFKAMKDVKV